MYGISNLSSFTSFVEQELRLSALKQEDITLKREEKVGKVIVENKSELKGKNNKIEGQCWAPTWIYIILAGPFTKNGISLGLGAKFQV